MVETIKGRAECGGAVGEGRAGKQTVPYLEDKYFNTPARYVRPSSIRGG